MKLTKVIDWLDQTLRVSDFDDVSNNGLQIARSTDEVKKVAVAVDASVAAVRAAARAGAQLLIVHHGISWGGGIRRLTGGAYRVVKAAMEADLAVYACHLPLDAHPTLGNNAALAKLFGLQQVRPAFSYHGNVIGLVGMATCARLLKGLKAFVSFDEESLRGLARRSALKVGVCSGGAGEFAETAQTLGCDLYVTGEASWGEVVAAENCGMKMLCLGHHATETFGVAALGERLSRQLKLPVERFF